MSEATTLEAPPETTPVNPADDGQTPPLPEASGSAEQQVEGGLAEATPEPVAPPQPRSPQEVDQLLRSDPNATLTAAEVRAHSSWQQSISSRRDQINRQRGEVDTVFTAAKDLSIAAIKAEIEAATLREREVDMDLIQQKLDGHFATLRANADKSALASYDADVDQWLFDAYAGDTASYEAVTKGKSLQEKQQTQLQIAFEMGRRAGPDPDSIVETKAERAAAIQAAVNASRAANPNRGASAGGANPTSSSRSDAQILADPTTPIQTLKEIRARQLAG